MLVDFSVMLIFKQFGKVFHVFGTVLSANFPETLSGDMGKTRDKNNLGTSLTKSQNNRKQTRSQKARNAAAKVLGPASVTDQNNIEEVMDKLNFVSLMSNSKKPDPSKELEEDSDEFEDISSDDCESYDEDPSDDEPTVLVEDACLVLRKPDQVSF